MQDVEELKSRDRMHDLARVGVRFIVFLYEQPTPSQVSLINAAKEMVHCVEICAPIARLEAVSAALAVCGLDRDIHLSFSEMGTSAAGHEPMAHYIWTGFDATKSSLNAHLAAVRSGGFSSAVLRMERTAASALEIQRIARTAAAAETHVILYARMASINGAEALTDDDANARLVSTLEIMGRLFRKNITIVTDTYADHDRGYYPRTGVVDRAYDLRSPGTAMGRIAGLLGAENLMPDAITDEVIAFRAAVASYLFIPNPAAIGHVAHDSLATSIKKSTHWKINKLCSPHGWADAVDNSDPAEVAYQICRIAEPVLLVSREG
jgi:hypothetical protein